MSNTTSTGFFSRNSIAIGVLLGFVFPLLCTLLFYGLFELLEQTNLVSDVGFRPMFRERTASIVGIAINAFLINYFSKRRHHQTVRGVIIITTVYIVLWLIFFGKYVI
jgi:uncharacterized BrkB/YihY/UPF0761 family membrane protein